MGCDFYIIRPDLPMRFVTLCYHCGKPVGDPPVVGHEECLNDDGELAVMRDVDMDEYEYEDRIRER